MNEADFIQALRAMAPHPAARGLADDCAVLDLGSETLILTHDAMAEGVHFLPDQDPADVAWKLVASNLSDLASKGAEPLGVLLGYMLGHDDARFLEGLHDALTTFDTPLLGGDTIAGKGAPQVLGLTALGRATHRPVPTRSGAQAGDLVYLSGPVGGAMIGFEALRDRTGADSSAYRRPVPQLAAGRALAPHVHAMMDVSDGLLIDAWRMAQASGVTFAIDSRAVPIAAPETRRDDAMRWGDDYQLLFTAAPDALLPLRCSAIGHVTARGESPLEVDGVAHPTASGLGYQHQNDT